MRLDQVLEALSHVAVFVAAIAAIYGIGTWRHEYVGKRRIDLAERVLALFYEARDVIDAIRCPFFYENEAEIPAQDAPAANRPWMKGAQVCRERYQKRQRFFARMQSARYRFMSQFGQEAAKPFDEMMKVLRDMSVAVLNYEMFGGETSADSKETMIGVRRTLFRTSEDPIAPRMDGMIAAAEEICGKIIRKPPRLLFWKRNKERSEQ